MKVATGILLASVMLAATPALAQSQAGAQGGAVGGATAGAVGGAIVGGPVGAVVGGVVGGTTGAAVGSLSADDRTYVHTYVERRHVPSVAVQEQIVVGRPLPSTVKTYVIEGNPHLSGYRYAYVNDRYYLVDNRDRVVTVIDR